MAYSPQVWINDETDVDEEHMMHMEEGIKNSYNISLLAVSASAPSECDEGDKYYNTITKKIYVATGTNTWPSEGTTPLKDILYILFSNNTAYAWNGENLVSVGGGGNPVEVNNGQLIIQKNETTVATFTANQSGNTTANISVPTKLSDLATVLYNASDGKGTAGNVTLNQSASNFNYLVIYYGNNNGDNRKSEIIYAPNGNKATLTINTYYQENASNFYHYYYSKEISISGTTITITKDWELRFLNRAINNQTQDQRIYIHRVEGYK